jgi:intracellular septation protein
VFVGSQYVGNRKPLVERMMSSAMQVPAEIWTKVNWMWAAFFVFIGVLNLIVAYNFSEAIWVDFKLFGILGLTLVFVIAQAIYLQRHAIETSKEP